MLSTQVSAVGLRLRHNRLACDSVLEVSRDAVAAGKEQLASCAAEQSKYCSICTVTLGHCGDLPFTSSGRWRCLRGGADAGLNSCYAACGCGTKYWHGALLGEGVWRHAHCPFAAQRGNGAHCPSQSNNPMVKKITRPWLARFFRLDLKLSSMVKIDSKR